MRRTAKNSYRFALSGLMLVFASSLALAQDQPPAPLPAPPMPQTGSWRHMNDQPPAAPQAAVQQNGQPQQNPEPVAAPNQASPQTAPGQMNNTPPAYGVPAQLTVAQGTYVHVRLNQILNSDKNHVGDTFSGTLMQPVVVDGIVVAPRGQMIYGRVTEAEKAHDGKDSRLGVELNSMAIVDGSQANISTRLVLIRGGRMPGRVESSTVVNTGTAGAAGPGVMLTHNHATIIDPGYELTFAVTAPVSISTAAAPQAFRYVGPEDYYQQGGQMRPGPQQGAVAAPYPYPYPYYGPWGYPYPYWGPSIGIGFGWGWGPRFGFGRRW